jgi:hypothetical protein
LWLHHWAQWHGDSASQHKQKRIPYLRFPTSNFHHKRQQFLCVRVSDEAAEMEVQDLARFFSFI